MATLYSAQTGITRLRNFSIFIPVLACHADGQILPVVFQLERGVDRAATPESSAIAANGNHCPVVADDMNIDLRSLADVLADLIELPVLIGGVFDDDVTGVHAKRFEPESGGLSGVRLQMVDKRVSEKG